MRVVQQVNALFNSSDFIIKANFLSQMKGGWERWFQMELAYHIAKTCSLGYDIKLEDNTVYPGTALRADLVLKCHYLTKTTTVVELKCQVASASREDFYDLIEADIGKLPALAPGDDYQVIALVRDRADIEPLYHDLATSHSDQVSRYTFPLSLNTPGGFVSFYRGGTN